MIAKDIFYLLPILSMLFSGCVEGDTSKPNSSPTTAEIIINNKTEHTLYQLYVRKSGTTSYNHDMIPDLKSISSKSKSSFETSMCGQNIDIKVTTRFKEEKWLFLDKDLPCNKSTEFTITY
jgi:Ulp1 family protease